MPDPLAMQREINSVRAGIVGGRIEESFAICRDIAQVQTDALGGMAYGAQVERLQALSERAGNLPPAWGTDAKALLDQAVTQLSRPQVGPRVEPHGLLSQAAYIPAARADTTVGAYYGDDWRTTLDRLSTPSTAQAPADAIRELHDLIDGATQAVSALPKQAAPPPSAPMQIEPFESLTNMDKILAPIIRQWVPLAEPGWPAPQVSAFAGAVVDRSNIGIGMAVGGGSAPAAPQPSAAQRALAAARKQLGQPYLWGGESRREGGFDCSGLTYAAYRVAGINLPRRSQEQWASGIGKRITKWEDLRPGDCIYFAMHGGTAADHTGIVADGGKMIVAPHKGDVVKREPLGAYWRERFLGAKRFGGG